MSDLPDFDKMREVAKAVGPNYNWAVGNSYDDGWGHDTFPVGPQWDPEDYPDGFDFVESTLLEVWGTEYDAKPTATFVALFDPPTVLDLVERAALRDAKYELVGTIDGENLYRRVK